MKTKLAGSLPLQEAIAQTLSDVRAKMKLASAEHEEGEEKVKKLLKFEKKEHGHVPSVKEEKGEYEKKSSVIDPADPEEVEKLAAALDETAGLLEKEADSVEMGTEPHQGGEVLPVQRPAAGKQPYPDKGKKKTPAGMSSKPADAPSQGSTATDEHHTPGGKGAKMPAQGVLRKTGGVAALKAEVEKTAKKADPFAPKNDHERAERWSNSGAAMGGLHAASKLTSESATHGAGKVGKAALVGYGAGRLAHRVIRGPVSGRSLEEKKEKKSAAGSVDYILGKIKAAGADLGGEAKQGGETLASTMPVKMQPGRSLIQNAQNLKNVTKPEAKAARKRELAEVLTEPASKRGQAPNITGNLRSASKGGVKTAAAKAYLAKIAEEGCTCKQGGSCKHCKMKKAAVEILSRKTDETQTTSKE